MKAYVYIALAHRYVCWRCPCPRPFSNRGAFIHTHIYTHRYPPTVGDKIKDGREKFRRKAEEMDKIKEREAMKWVWTGEVSDGF